MTRYVTGGVCSWDGRFTGMEGAVSVLQQGGCEGDCDVQQRWKSSRDIKTRSISVAQSFVAFDSSHHCRDCKCDRDPFAPVDVEIRSIYHPNGEVLLEVGASTVRVSNDQFIKDVTSRRTIIQISYRQKCCKDNPEVPIPAPELALLNYYHALGDVRGEFQQVIVVRREHFERYCQVWASVRRGRYVVALPDKMRNCLDGDNEWVSVKESGSGYARAFCQLLAHSLGLKHVHMWDDNVREVRELYVEDGQGGHALRADDASLLEVEKRLVPFSRAMCYFENMYNEHRAELIADQRFTIERLLLPGVSFRAENIASPVVPNIISRESVTIGADIRCPLTSDQIEGGKRWRCVGKEEEFFLAGSECAITGMHRDIMNFAICKPFNRTHTVYSAFLLHNSNALKKGIIYPLRKKVWEVCTEYPSVLAVGLLT